MSDEKNPPVSEEQNLENPAIDNVDNSADDDVSVVRKRGSNEYFRQMAIDKAIEREREKKLRNGE